nr:MAG TPA: hypothetical protein [Caudoviricetes sp.]
MYGLQYAYISYLLQVISYLIRLVLDVPSLQLSFLNQLFLHPYQVHLILFQLWEYHQRIHLQEPLKPLLLLQWFLYSLIHF